MLLTAITYLIHNFVLLCHLPVHCWEKMHDLFCIRLVFSAPCSHIQLNSSSLKCVLTFVQSCYATDNFQRLQQLEHSMPLRLNFKRSVLITILYHRSIVPLKLFFPFTDPSLTMFAVTCKSHIAKNLSNYFLSLKNLIQLGEK